MTGQPSEAHGRCPVCGREMPVQTRSGAVFWHHDQNTGRPCQGWVQNMRPEQATTVGGMMR
ncbi:MAG TPA: hypothetical protein VF506_06430 [Streptosporangiaceae bacterium]